jgi:hypothetical protein
MKFMFFPMFRLLSPDDGGGGGGEEVKVIKFGGVEVNLEASPEEMVAQLTEAKKAYDSSSTQAIELNKKIKELEKNPPKPSDDKALTPEAIRKMIDDEVSKRTKGLETITTKSQELNLRRSIEDLDKSFVDSYKALPKEVFEKTLTEAKELFNSQEPSMRTEAVYQNIVKVHMSDALVQNVGNIGDEAAIQRLASNPALASKFIGEYGEKLGLNVTIPNTGGFTTEAEFKTLMSEKRAEFKKAKGSNKSKVAQEIAALRNQGQAFGFRI